jgi:epoxide hydrolase-like predicted phosphatase
VKINTIFLDIGMVLVGLNYEPALQTLSDLNGLPADEITHRLENHSGILDYEKGLLTTEEFFEQLTDLLGIDASLEMFKGIWASVLVVDGEGSQGLLSSELFQQLRRNYRVIALSNTNEMQFSYLSRVHPLITQFDDYVLSYQVGHLKPDPEIYRVALQKSGASPEESLFVDDLVENIKVAEQIGMTGVVFKGEPQLIEDLEELGILTG